MDMKEFNDTVKRSEQGDEIIFDVRPFSARQSEAIESYIHGRLMHLHTTGIGTTRKLCVSLCDASVQIPDTTKTWLANLLAGGQRAEIRVA
jgi:hypothetical protein